MNPGDRSAEAPYRQSQYASTSNHKPRILICIVALSMTWMHVSLVLAKKQIPGKPIQCAVLTTACQAIDAKIATHVYQHAYGGSACRKISCLVRVKGEYKSQFDTAFLPESTTSDAMITKVTQICNEFLRSPSCTARVKGEAPNMSATAQIRFSSLIGYARRGAAQGYCASAMVAVIYFVQRGTRGLVVQTMYPRLTPLWRDDGRQ